MGKTKSEKASSLTSKPHQFLTDDTVRLGLRNLIWGSNPVLTVKDAADAANCHERTIYAYLEDTENRRTIPCEKFILIARLASERGDFSLSDLAVPPGYIISPIDEEDINGSLDDEIAEITEDLGSAHSNFAKGKYGNVKKAITDAKVKLARMESEVKFKEEARS